MSKHTTTLIIGLIMISCGGSNHFRIQNSYKISSGSINIDSQLVHQVFYDKEGVKEKELVYNPSKTIFQKLIGFDSKGNKTSEITYYDSAKTFGIEVIYKYDDKILTQAIAINIVESDRTDTTIIDYSNELDSLGRLLKSVSVSENDTNIIEYQYTDFNKISNVLFKTGSRLISYENYYYNDKGQKQEHVIRIPDYNIEKREIYTYTDTLLTQIISLKNSDTLRIDRFKYNARRLKKSIETVDYKTDDVINIKIEYKK